MMRRAHFSTTLFLCLYLATFLVPSTARAQLDPDAIRDSVRVVYESDEYQTALPELKEIDIPDYGMSMPMIPGLGTLVLILLAAIAVAVIAIVVFKRVSRRSAYVAPVTEPVAGVRVSEAPLGDAERLAAAGQFGEAVHVLLLRTIEEIRDSLSFVPSPSLTSREINRLAPISEHASATLGQLITRVEVSYFGEIPAGEQDYLECVVLFRTFVDACRGARS